LRSRRKLLVLVLPALVVVTAVFAIGSQGKRCGSVCSKRE
jgi:hypothetical protein